MNEIKTPEVLTTWATRDKKYRIDLCSESDLELEGYSVHFYTNGQCVKKWDNILSRRIAEQKIYVYLDTAKFTDKLVYKRAE